MATRPPEPLVNASPERPRVSERGLTVLFVAAFGAVTVAWLVVLTFLALGVIRAIF